MSHFLPEPVAVTNGSWIGISHALFAVFSGKDMIVYRSGDRIGLVSGDCLAHFYQGPALKVGMLDEVSCYAAEIPEGLLPDVLPADVVRVPFRIAVGQIPEDLCPAVYRGRELLHWQRQHIHCGHCGEKLTESSSDMALVCQKCGERYYPQLAPAVIVGILRGDQILLAHNKRFENGMFGLIAGFVEAGESVEDAIVREIREETGIEIGNVRYFSSQSWPFPNSLMLAYYADYVSGEAKADGVELESVGWFSADALPVIPRPGSIARRLIDDFVANHKKTERN